MPRYFFDSSAILKRYVQEQGSTWVRTVCGTRARSYLYLSELAQTEVVAALRREGRTLVVQQGFHRSAIDATVNIFERDVLRSVNRPGSIYDFIPLTTRTVTLARQLCNSFWLPPTPSLRSLDAIQLASALIARTIAPDPVIFVTADARLEIIAQSLGFTTDNPLHHP